MGRIRTTHEDITFSQMSKRTESLPGWLHVRAKEVAKKKGVSLHLFIEIAVKQAVERYDKQGY